MPVPFRAHVLACLQASCLLAACGGSGKSDIGRSTGAAVHDTELMRAATAAVNEAVRAGSDCEAAKPLADEAQQKLDELEPQVGTTTGRVALDSLRAQLRRVQQACP
jgi:hypothetical protein